MKMKKLKKIPHFKTEAEERKFWQSVDTTEYVDYSHVEHWSFPDLKLTKDLHKEVEISLPAEIVSRLKARAVKMKISYQSLIKKILSDHLAKN